MQAEPDQGGPEHPANGRGRRRAGGRSTRPSGSGAGWEQASGWGDARAKEQEEGGKVPAYRKALRKKQRAPEIGARGGGRTDRDAPRAQPGAALCTVRSERGTAWSRIFFTLGFWGCCSETNNRLGSALDFWSCWAAAGDSPGHRGGVAESPAVSHRALCLPRLRAPSGFCEPLDGTDSDLPGPRAQFVPKFYPT